jgi:alcohol dehydrogenase class IV
MSFTLALPRIALIGQWVKPALADPCTPGNPRDLSPGDVRALYRKAL